MKYFTPEEVLEKIKSYNSTMNCNNDDRGQHIMYDEVIQIFDKNAFMGFTFSVNNYYRDGAWYKQTDMMEDEKILDKIKSYSYAKGAEVFLFDCDYKEVTNPIKLGETKILGRNRAKGNLS